MIKTVSLIVMPTLAWAKRRTASAMRSRTPKANSTQTTLCTYLSASTLAGLAANAAFGWTWADPAAALVIAAVAAKEGREAWRGDNYCD